ncbi:SDR family oxidoreductase [Burkholderia sp. 22PA0106]|uniref:SDR family oxidoreductase n=1 Tax=Burkholderia sp. 22PA0106 TaxID=3237371 RepID=UPI0039C291AC
MILTGNTIFVTGGASGIGRALAESFHRLGNQVVISGRRQNALDDVTRENPGMRSVCMDVTQAEQVKSVSRYVMQTYPELNVLINNAGIMRPEDVVANENYIEDAEEILSTNFLGPARLTAALLSHLRGRPRATIINVSSDLAFVPMVTHPTYCASKAALHSYSMSLRHQLIGTSIELIELIPPYVQTSLMGTQQLTDERAMPLEAYIRETMDILSTQPGIPEVVVDRCKPFRFSAENGTAEHLFEGLNVTHELG